MELSATPIETGRFALRPFRRRDVEALHSAVHTSLAELHQWLPWAHLGYSQTDAIQFIKESTRAWKETRAYDYAIRSDTEPEVHFGNISIWFVSRGFRTGEIGYWVRTDRTGEGIGTEVAARMTQIGFETLNMHRIVLRIAVGNDASARLATKLGYTREGVLREELKVRGKWLDHAVFSMLDHEYQKHRDRLASLVSSSSVTSEGR